MSKTIIWWIVGVVIVGGGYFAISHKNIPVNVADISANNEINTSGGKLSLLDYIKRGDSYKCTVNQNLGTVDNQGMLYISNNIVRGDFNMKVQTMNINTNFIFKDGYTYTWTSSTPGKGYKMKLPTAPGTDIGEAMANGIATMVKNPTANKTGQDVGYNCEPWSADQSKFALPSEITFQDLQTVK